MTAWVPGLPVDTEQKKADWLAWRRERKRQQQRDRRKRLRRIDYYASPDAVAALIELWRPRPNHDFSSLLDTIVREWLAKCHRNKKPVNSE